jgi:hypothetical protein
LIEFITLLKYTAIIILMNIFTIITAILVLGIVLGGLAIFLFKAYRSEIKKISNGSS